MEIILASTSSYRQALLRRLQLRFSCEPPGVEEEPLPQELPEAMAERLALAKATAVASRFPDALVIGSDQVATLDGEVLGKPGTYERAREQLLKSSGRRVDFYTGIAVLCPARGFHGTHVESFRVYFRELDPGEIDAYLHREAPYDCAGSFKCEGLGIALFARLEGDDPTALEGLPLIALCRLLSAAGCAVLPTVR
jgi:septum formation protein